MDSDRYPEAMVDGFPMRMFVSYDDCGDAWVQAPAGSVGTLIWETGDPPCFPEVIAPEPDGRWGTYAVQQPLPLTADAEAAEYLHALPPELCERRQLWRAQRSG